MCPYHDSDISYNIQVVLIVMDLPSSFYSANFVVLIFLWKLRNQSLFFQFDVILNSLVRSVRCIWIPMLWIYGHYTCFTFSVLDSDVYSVVQQSSDGSTAVPTHRVSRYVWRHALRYRKTALQRGMYSHLSPSHDAKGEIAAIMF